VNPLSHLLAAARALLLVQSAWADPLPRAKPEDVGLSSARLERLGQILRADVARGRLPGAVVLIAPGEDLLARDGKLAGQFDWLRYR
jgi:hypothetical protein